MNFIFAEEDIISGIGYSSRYRSQAMPSSTTTRFGSARSEPYYGTYASDRRPTKAQGHKRVQDFRDRRDAIVETWESIPDTIIDTESLDLNIPWWVKGPFYVAPYVADLLIEIDPMDKYRD